MKYFETTYRWKGLKYHVGLVACCNKGEKYGVIYGFRQLPYISGKVKHENKLLYFEKELNYVLKRNTLIFYQSIDFDDRIKFSTKVDFIAPISDLVMNFDSHTFLRDDGIYHDDNTWFLINKGIPFRDLKSVTVPSKRNGTIFIHSSVFSGREADVYEMYTEIRKINYMGWPSIEDVSKKLADFTKQVESTDVNAVIDTFQIKKINHYNRCPGKDDYYTETLHQGLTGNDDKYLSFLLPTKQEVVFCDNNAYPSDGYSSGINLLEKETMQAREIAKLEYSRENHIAYLINDYFSDVVERKERTEYLRKRIQYEFDVDNASEISSQFKGQITDEFIALVNEYNESTVIGPL